MKLNNSSFEFTQQEPPSRREKLYAPRKIEFEEVDYASIKLNAQK
jgi:hypothetical protein